jgi:hypothetical protein
MTQRPSLSAVLVIGGAAAILLAGPGTARAQYASPSPTGGDVVDKTRAGAEKVGEKVKEGAEKTGDAVKDAAHDVKKDAKPVAKDVGEKVKEGAHKTGDALDAAKQHVDVKAALLADKNVDASHIDIDIDKDTKTLYLRGTVPTEGQKVAAGRIAREKASDYLIRNQLTVMVRP